jgi:hypothetical protein
MRLYNQGCQKSRWKDPKISNVETQAHANVSGLGTREGIGLGWSCKFKLNGLDV